MGNQMKTALLLGLLTAFIVWIGHWLGGRQGMILALVIAAVMNFFSYWYSDKLVLKMYRAQEVSPGQSPELYGLVQQLARNGNLPMPKVYIVPDDAPNAFATGRNPDHAVVAVTRGLLQTMNREELSGVLAHELSHIKNRDILIGSIAATMAGAIMLLANMVRWSAIFGGFGRDDQEGGGGFLGLLAMSIIAPLAAMIVQMAISRSREYLADQSGAAICGNPEWLARALEKLGAASGRLPATANPSTAHMLIVNPLSGKSMMKLFSTHPPLEERIARLRGRSSDGGRSANRTDETGPNAEKNGRQHARDVWNSLR